MVYLKKKISKIDYSPKLGYTGYEMGDAQQMKRPRDARNISGPCFVSTKGGNAEMPPPPVSL
jgi:hypothetical protein